MIYPNNFEHKIGFEQIRVLLKSKCLSTLGEDRVDSMAFSKDFTSVSEWLDQTNEFLQIILEQKSFPDQYFFDVRPSLNKIKVEGMYLEEPELFDFRRSLDTIIQIINFLHETPEDQEEGDILYPNLYNLIGEVQVYPRLLKDIDAIIDKYGKVKDNASNKLLSIRRELASTTSGISSSLNRILRNAQKDGYVEKDAAPTLRDGRLVIPVAPALKRKLKGIVHDESASGKTVFIEPAEVVEANNRIRELEAEERKEIIRILIEFSTAIRPYLQDILESYEFLAEIDFIRAKAYFALENKCIRPTVINKPLLKWDTAIHPLLQRALARVNKKVVPLDIELDGKNRILIISGPNAGGKSVCLKTVGLLQYMTQNGLLIPIRENSEVGIFGSIFMDIGDEQSIEDDLSTYSSHLTNMKMMVKNCNDNSLLLIDEFGGGTEPQIGGAIAEALLKRFNEQKAFGVITTHYQNLKHYAEDHEGIINGAMLYDRHQMQALFQLEIGNPGSSFAVEIARKIGLPEEIIQDASDIVGAEYINADKYLQDIVRDKRYWEKKRRNIRQKEKEMEDTIAKYAQEIESLHKEKKEIIKKSQEEAKNLLQQSNSVIENTIRSIKEAQAEKNKTKDARKNLDDFKRHLNEMEAIDKKDAIARKMEQIKNRQERKQQRKEEKRDNKPIVKKESPIEVGSHVRIKGQNSVGEVLEINGKNVIVLFGQLKTTTKLAKLEKSNTPVKAAPKNSVISGQTHDSMHEKKLNFKQELDVRGMRGDEALQAISYFIDDAILVGVNRVSILHGTGTGILRSLTRDFLASNPGVRDYHDEHVQFGGAGKTVVEL